MKKLLRILIVLTIVIAPFLYGSAVLAIDDPDSDPSISNVKANRYLLESGDVLIYGDYNIPYATVPGESATNSFIFRLLDGSTEKGVILPYSLMDNGYNEGVFSFYFSAADNLTWGEAYTIRISQNPAQFEDPTYIDYEIPASAYTSSTAQADNKIELAINIIAAATRLEVDHTSYTFLDSSASGTVLSSPTGETYFRNVVYGLQLMAPSLFLVQTLEIDTADTVWLTTQADNYTDRFTGTWVGDNATSAGDEFNLSGASIMGLMVILPLCIGSIIVSSIKFKKAEPGFILTALFLIPALMMGWMPHAIFATIYQAMGIYLGYVWFYARG